MLQWFYVLFSSIFQFFSNIWQGLVWLWDQITQFFQIIKPAIHFFMVLVGSIPTFFYVFAVAILLVCIVYIILGRNAGGD